jgi:hypothetical protein
MPETKYSYNQKVALDSFQRAPNFTANSFTFYNKDANKVIVDAIRTDEQGNVIFKDSNTEVYLKDIVLKAQVIDEELNDDGSFTLYFSDKFNRRYSLGEIYKILFESQPKNLSFWFGDRASRFLYDPMDDLIVDNYLKVIREVDPLDPQNIVEYIEFEDTWRNKWIDIPCLEVVTPDYVDGKYASISANVCFKIKSDKPLITGFRIYDATTGIELTRVIHSAERSASGYTSYTVPLGYQGPLPDTAFPSDNEFSGLTYRDIQNIQIDDGVEVGKKVSDNPLQYESIPITKHVIRIQWITCDIAYEIDNIGNKIGNYGRFFDERGESSLDVTIFSENLKVDQVIQLNGEINTGALAQGTTTYVEEFDNVPLGLDENYSISFSTNKNVNVSLIDKTTTGFSLEWYKPVSGLIINWSIYYKITDKDINDLDRINDKKRTINHFLFTDQEIATDFCDDATDQALIEFDFYKFEEYDYVIPDTVPCGCCDCCDEFRPVVKFRLVTGQEYPPSCEDIFYNGDRYDGDMFLYTEPAEGDEDECEICPTRVEHFATSSSSYELEERRLLDNGEESVLGWTLADLELFSPEHETKKMPGLEQFGSPARSELELQVINKEEFLDGIPRFVKIFNTFDSNSTSSYEDGKCTREIKADSDISFEPWPYGYDKVSKPDLLNSVGEVDDPDGTPIEFNFPQQPCELITENETSPSFDVSTNPPPRNALYGFIYNNFKQIRKDGVEIEYPKRFYIRTKSPYPGEPNAKNIEDFEIPEDGVYHDGNDFKITVYPDDNRITFHVREGARLGVHQVIAMYHAYDYETNRYESGFRYIPVCFNLVKEEGVRGNRYLLPCPIPESLDPPIGSFWDPPEGLSPTRDSSCLKQTDSIIDGSRLEIYKNVTIGNQFPIDGEGNIHYCVAEDDYGNVRYFPDEKDITFRAEIVNGVYVPDTRYLPIDAINDNVTPTCVAGIYVYNPKIDIPKPKDGEEDDNELTVDGENPVSVLSPTDDEGNPLPPEGAGALNSSVRTCGTAPVSGPTPPPSFLKYDTITTDDRNAVLSSDTIKTCGFGTLDNFMGEGKGYHLLLKVPKPFNDDPAVFVFEHYTKEQIGLIDVNFSLGKIHRFSFFDQIDDPEDPDNFLFVGYILEAEEDIEYGDIHIKDINLHEIVSLTTTSPFAEATPVIKNYQVYQDLVLRADEYLTVFPEKKMQTLISAFAAAIRYEGFVDQAIENILNYETIFSISASPTSGAGISGYFDENLEKANVQQLGVGETTFIFDTSSGAGISGAVETSPGVWEITISFSDKDIDDVFDVQTPNIQLQQFIEPEEIPNMEKIMPRSDFELVSGCQSLSMSEQYAMKFITLLKEELSLPKPGGAVIPEYFTRLWEIYGVIGLDLKSLKGSDDILDPKGSEKIKAMKYDLVNSLIAEPNEEVYVVKIPKFACPEVIPISGDGVFIDDWYEDWFWEGGLRKDKDKTISSSSSEDSRKVSIVKNVRKLTPASEIFGEDYTFKGLEFGSQESYIEYENKIGLTREIGLENLKYDKKQQPEELPVQHIDDNLILLDIPRNSSYEKLFDGEYLKVFNPLEPNYSLITQDGFLGVKAFGHNVIIFDPRPNVKRLTSQRPIFPGFDPIYQRKTKDEILEHIYTTVYPTENVPSFPNFRIGDYVVNGEIYNPLYDSRNYRMNGYYDVDRSTSEQEVFVTTPLSDISPRYAIGARLISRGRYYTIVQNLYASSGLITGRYRNKLLKVKPSTVKFDNIPEFFANLNLL